MKKGCFIKLIIAFTIIVAAALYIIKNHFDDLVIKPGKKILKEMAIENLDKKLAPIKNTPEKDSLKVLINMYVENKINNIDFSEDNDSTDDVNIGFDFSNTGKSEVEAEIHLISDSLDSFLKDNIIDENELLKFKEILKEKINE